MTFSLRQTLVGSGLTLIATVLLVTGVGSATTPEPAADFKIIEGAEAVIPVSLEAGEVIVEVIVDGRGPFPLMFDTGRTTPLHLKRSPYSRSKPGAPGQPATAEAAASRSPLRTQHQCA